jgi:2-C-methyl-D-erythritol 4-phosphate cytidylyltransferase
MDHGYDAYDEPPRPVGVVPVDGRGSLPFALIHGESLVAAASWALGEAGVDLLDFTTSWPEVQARGVALVVHDPLCPGAPAEFLRSAAAAAADGRVVVGVRPVTDTVKHVDGDRLGDTVDRAGLRVVASPVVLPAAVVAALPEPPVLDDLADLVVRLAADHEIQELEAPPVARRVVDDSDLRLVEGLSG